MVGTTIVTMEELLDTDTSTISNTFIVGGMGYMSGALLCGAVFDRANKELILAVALCLQCVCPSIAPFTGNVYAYMVVMGFNSLGMALTDSGVFLFCKYIHTLW